MADSAEADRLYSGSGTTPEGSEAFRVRLVSETSSSLQNSILTIRNCILYVNGVAFAISRVEEDKSIVDRHRYRTSLKQRSKRRLP